MTVRIALPTHLRTLAHVTGEVTVDVAAPITQTAVLDALETAHPVLRGTIRDRGTGRRRPFVRFFVDEEDRSHDDPDDPLPDALADALTSGRTPFRIVGAMAGG